MKWQEHFEEHYYPLSEEFIVESLNDLGYGSVQIMNFPAQYQDENMEDADWITIIAKKS